LLLVFAPTHDSVYYQEPYVIYIDIVLLTYGLVNIGVIGHFLSTRRRKYVALPVSSRGVFLVDELDDASATVTVQIDDEESTVRFVVSRHVQVVT